MIDWGDGRRPGGDGGEDMYMMYFGLEVKEAGKLT